MTFKLDLKLLYIHVLVFPEAEPLPGCWKTPCERQRKKPNKFSLPMIYYSSISDGTSDYTTPATTPRPSLYSPLSLSCFTVNATLSRSCSSLVCDAFRPVATEALGLRPA